MVAGGPKRAIRVETVQFSRRLAKVKTRVEGNLVRKLEEAHSRSITADILAARLGLKEIFNTKHCQN